MKKIFAFILVLLLIFVTPVIAFAEGAEGAAEGEIQESEPAWEEVKETISEKIENWILPHIEEISVIITLLLSIVYNIRRNKALDKSVGTLNNNAITIAKTSAEAMSEASGAVTGYQTNIVALLEAYKQTAEDRQALASELAEVKKYLQTSKSANIEFANELAELLSLANIPNYKKEEIGARHLAAVNAIAKAETEEVKKDVGEEA